MHYLGLSGVPRRYYAFDVFETFNGYPELNKIISIAAIIVFLAQFIFVVNFFYSIYKGKKVTEENKNPWKATTLEWTTPINPGHGNWPGAIPEVYRWPYDYSRYDDAEEDFIPQTVPYSEEEKKKMADEGHTY